jgi:hypothetical protein
VTAVRVTAQIALFGAALADSQQTEAGAHNRRILARHIGSAATVRDGTCVLLYALAAAVRRPRRCRRMALTVITTAASTASITQVRIRSPVSAR